MSITSMDEKLNAYIDNELPPEEVANVESLLVSSQEYRLLYQQLIDAKSRYQDYVEQFSTSHENQLTKEILRGVKSESHLSRYIYTAVAASIFVISCGVFFVQIPSDENSHQYSDGLPTKSANLHNVNDSFLTEVDFDVYSMDPTTQFMRLMDI